MVPVSVNNGTRKQQALTLDNLPCIKAGLHITICLMLFVGSKDVACDTPVYTIRDVAHYFYNLTSRCQATSL